MKSVPPPAGNGTIILIGFCGHACPCAGAGASAASASAAAIVVMIRLLIVLFIILPVCFVAPPSRAHGRCDGIAHLLRAGGATEVARQVPGLGDHLLHGGMDEAGGGRRLRLVVLAAEPGEQHLAR